MRDEKGTMIIIKNIVFDMGNVLIRYVSEEFIGQFTVHTSEQSKLLQQIFKSPRWLEFDRGTITKEQLVIDAKKELSNDLHPLVSEILEKWHEEMTVNTEMDAVIEGLEAQGYSLYLLSNASQDFYIFKETIPVLKHFDGLFISSDWECLKPEPVIFQKFFEHFDINPEESFFIDDLAENIEAASDQGMQGHVFDGNVEALLSAFRKNDIKY